MAVSVPEFFYYFWNCQQCSKQPRTGALDKLRQAKKYYCSLFLVLYIDTNRVGEYNRYQPAISAVSASATA